MPEYLVGSGLPAQPAGLDDKDFRLVNPLYSGVGALARAIAGATNQVKFSQTELAQRNQLGSLAAAPQNIIYPLFPAAMTYGQLVNLYVSGGKLAAQPADQSTGLPAHGILNNTAGADAGSYAEVILMQGLTGGITGSVVGQFYYLSTAGLVQATVPGAGLVQKVGVGFDTGGFYLNIQAP